MTSGGGVAVASAAISRADLLRALLRGGEAGLLQMADRLGYREVARRDVETSKPTRSGRTDAPKVAPQPEATEQHRRLFPIPFWRLERVEHVSREERLEPAPVANIRESEIGPAPTTRPVFGALATRWSRLWPALDASLRSQVASRELDARRLVELWSRGELVEKLPRRAASAWASRVCILTDRGPHLTPMWRDQDHLRRQLRRRLGPKSLIGYSRSDFDGGLWRESRTLQTVRLPRVDSGTAILALSDLGLFSSATEQKGWLRLGRELVRSGCRLSALVPAPSGRWLRSLAGVWNAVDWAMPSRCAGLFGAGLSDGELRARSERLLRLVSPVSQVEPGLLRGARLLLGPEHADLGTELDAWNHAETLQVKTILELSPPLASRLRASFSDEREDLRLATLSLLQAWRATVSREVWAEELAGLEALGGVPDESFREDLARAHDLLVRIASTAEGRSDASPELVRATQTYILRLGERIPVEIGKHPALITALGKAWVAAQQVCELPVPPWVSADLIGVPATPRRWHLWQRGEVLEFLSALSPQRGGSELAFFEASASECLLAPSERHAASRVVLEERSKARLPAGPELVLRTDRQHLHLRRFEKPPWASAIGRDKFGLWAEIEIKDVTHRLRWIPPGRFWMGSPETEQGRWDDEGPRHVVTLTEGYWLGETPCTQALWTAVMDRNPSRFQTPDRPVERVSWEDCQRFLARMNVGSEERERWSLPSEVQWEFACRAGTETSTYAGELEILGTCNGPLLDDIAWYGGNSGRDYDLKKGEDSSKWPEKQYPHAKAGSRRVKTKLPNAWGLYDMLGNVWEWCEDWWANRYESDPGFDPTGPAMGSVRVIRGGSWPDNASYVRAAARFGYSPDSRSDFLGFRLARGQHPAPASQVQPARSAGSAAPASGAAEPARVRRPETARGRPQPKAIPKPKGGGAKQ